MKGETRKRVARVAGVMAAVMMGAAMLAGTAAGWGQGAASDKKAEEAKPIAAMGWLVGGVWTADASKMAPGMKIETRYQWSDNGAYIRFNTHFVFEKGTAKQYDGNFFWNPAQRALAMWYMDAKNGITEGPVEVNGDMTKMSFHGPDFEGNEADMRVFVAKKTKDDYRWSVEEKQSDSTWKEVAALEYLRTN
jgi:hypothetical protein